MIGGNWQFVADTVMGGVSIGRIERSEISGKKALRLTGRVSLENNGGFVQAALPLADLGKTLDAGAFEGIALTVRGNGEMYAVHLRTTDLNRPWQSYRATFLAMPQWQTIRLPFSDFQAYRTDAPLDLGKLRRLGLVAIGCAFDADLAVGRIAIVK